MKRYNISVPKNYQKDGVEKTAWNTVGTLVKFDATNEKEESFILELNMFPSTKFGVFKQDKKNETVETIKKDIEKTLSTPEEEEINPEDIPF